MSLDALREMKRVFYSDFIYKTNMGNNFFAFISFIFLCFSTLVAETTSPPKATLEAPPQAPEAPGKIEVNPQTRDDEIQKRLTDILTSTGWFTSPSVEVKDGVVFLKGETHSEEFKTWAGNLARNTRDVTAVVNKISIIQTPIWDFDFVWDGLKKEWSKMLLAIPSFVAGILILFFAWQAARLTVLIVRRLLRHKFHQMLLREVIARMAGFCFFLLGIYIVFEISNLTSAALTVVGGTGLIGIILGIAFRDITENFLASILLSIQNPFRNGDLIEINGVTGYVQYLTMRVTMIMTLDGNHVQIPNTTVYKSNIRNFSSNPNRREEFAIGISYEDPISLAQETALKVLGEHEAVLKDPEPMALVDSLGKSAVILRIYFWFDGSKYSALKVKSSLIRLIKRALQEQHISIPDEGRERIFPKGLPIQMLEPKEQKPTKEAHSSQEPKETEIESKTELESEAKDIEELASQSSVPEEGKNFLVRKQKPSNTSQ